MHPPGQSRPTQKSWWQRRIRSAFTERLTLKSIALLLAVVLWFTVSVREPAEQVLDVRFLPTFDPGVTLREQPAPIRALVRGSGRDILKLYSSPPAIRLSISGDLRDSLVVPIRPSDVDLPPGVSAVVREVQPRQLTLRFTERRRRTSTRRRDVVPMVRVQDDAAGGR